MSVAFKMKTLPKRPIDILDLNFKTVKLFEEYTSNRERNKLLDNELEQLELLSRRLGSDGSGSVRSRLSECREERESLRRRNREIDSRLKEVESQMPAGHAGLIAGVFSEGLVVFLKEHLCIMQLTKS